MLYQNNRFILNAYVSIHVTNAKIFFWISVRLSVSLSASLSLGRLDWFWWDLLWQIANDIRVLGYYYNNNNYNNWDYFLD